MQSGLKTMNAEGINDENANKKRIQTQELHERERKLEHISAYHAEIVFVRK